MLPNSGSGEPCHSAERKKRAPADASHYINGKKNLKQTRRHSIEQKVFTLGDLKRVSSIFEKQGQLARQSDHHYLLKYDLHFADHTSLDKK